MKSCQMYSLILTQPLLAAQLWQIALKTIHLLSGHAASGLAVVDAYLRASPPSNKVRDFRLELLKLTL
jgi:hypothetical protein